MTRLALFIAVVAVVSVPGTADARQSTAAAAREEAGSPRSSPSPGGAFVRSLVLPGLGHRYANGRWGTGGTAFAVADATLLASLFGVTWRRSNLVDSYEALAVSRAGADMEGKDRTFVLRLASYRSSDEFVEVSLRNRAWEDIGYVDDESYRWNWDSDEDFLRFRDLRNDAESLGRRRSLVIATLVANRILSGILAARQARRGAEAPVAVSLSPRSGSSAPAVDLVYRF